MEDLQKFHNNPRQSLAQKATGLFKDYWVICSLIVGIISVGIYGLIQDSDRGTNNYIIDGNKYPINPSDGENFASKYWISKINFGGHFSNFSNLISEELDRNFKEINRTQFTLKMESDGALNKTNWKRLFDEAEQLVKGFKMIAFNEESLKDKLKDFNAAEAKLEECKKQIAFNNQYMEEKAGDLMNYNVTIVKEEAILENLNDELKNLNNKRGLEIQQKNVLISSKIKEREQQKQIFEQKINKEQYQKELVTDVNQKNQTVYELKFRIRQIEEEKKMIEDRHSYNEQRQKALADEIADLQFNIQRLELNGEIDEIVSRVKREEHISNTKQLIGIIFKRINLINSHKIQSQNISPELLQTFENDKVQLRDLNNLQINLIRSFRKNNVGMGGKSLEQLRQDYQLKKSQHEEVTKELANKDKKVTNFDQNVDDLENQINQFLNEIESQQTRIAELSDSIGSDGEVNTEGIKQTIKRIDQEIAVLKEEKSNTEHYFQSQIDNFIKKIKEQKQEIEKLKNNFGGQLSKRSALEENLIYEINRCRQYRFMMDSIQNSAEQTQIDVHQTLKKLINIKYEIYGILEDMVPGFKEDSEEDEHDNVESSEETGK